MRRFWLCFTSILLPVCLHVYCIGIPALFHFPLEKLAFFDGPGKTTKREALTCFRSFSPYLFAFFYLFLTLPTPSLFEFLSYFFFSACILYPLSCFPPLLSAHLWIDTHIHSCSLNTNSQLLGTSAWMCLCVWVWSQFGVKDTFCDVYVCVQW